MNYQIMTSDHSNRLLPINWRLGVRKKITIKLHFCVKTHIYVTGSKNTGSAGALEPVTTVTTAQLETHILESIIKYLIYIANGTSRNNLRNICASLCSYILSVNSSICKGRFLKLVFAAMWHPGKLHTKTNCCWSHYLKPCRVYHVLCDKNYINLKINDNAGYRWKYNR